jgi:hypothetical protein
MVWSDEFAWALLSSLPEPEISKQWGTATVGTNETTGELPDQLQRELVGWARYDTEVRSWLVNAWRETHADLVAAADQAVIEGFSKDAVRHLESFASKEALLAFLTDEFDDGRALARSFLSRLEDSGERRQWLAVLGSLVGHHGKTSPRRIRLVILGGGHRDESRVCERVFENSPFDVRWRTFEKKTGSGLVKRGVVSMVRDADALLIITGTASHILAQIAKEYAQRNDTPWRCIEKATDSQLRATVREMFPDLTVDWV